MTDKGENVENVTLSRGGGGPCDRPNSNMVWYSSAYTSSIICNWIDEQEGDSGIFITA